MGDRRKAEEGDLIGIRKLARENKRMALPLKQANEDLYQLGEQLAEHDADQVVADPKKTPQKNTHTYRRPRIWDFDTHATLCRARRAPLGKKT